MKSKRTCKNIFMLVALFAVLSVFTSVKADAAALVPKEVNNSGDMNAAAASIDITLPVGTKDVTKSIVSVKINHGGVLKIFGTGTNGTELKVYSDVACTQKVRTETASAELTFFGDNQEKSKELIIPKAGTYYLALTYWLDSAAKAGNGSAHVWAYAYNGEDRTLTSGKYSVAYTDDYNKTVYHKIVMKSAGYIELSGNSFYNDGTKQSLYFTITNSKKKVISDSLYMNSSKGYRARVAVKKGTYYVAVKSSSIYQLSYKSKAIKEKSGKSKKKAVQLKKKKKVSGLMLMGESKKKADWYKIKLTKKQKLNLEVTNNGEGSIYVEVIPANSRVFLIGRSFSVSAYDSEKRTTEKKMPKGTYYVKVTKFYNTSSSHYTLKTK